MVGTGGARTNLISLESVDVNTSFGAYANKFVQNNIGRAAVHGTALDDRQVLSLKKSWHKLYAHCLQQIDSRFPQENMHIFKLMQVIDPSIVHGPLRRQLIGTDDLIVVVGHLLHIFEIPVHTAEIALLEEIKNSFVAFRASEFCADLWKEMKKYYAGLRQRGKPIDYTLIYPYYRQLMQMPDLKPWALFALFVLVFPTGNAISERGVSAMGSVHCKQRSELSHDQVFAHLIIGFNGPTVAEFAAQLDIESKQPINWRLYIPKYVTTSYNSYSIIIIL
jgi:hypothetical protein